MKKLILGFSILAVFFMLSFVIADESSSKTTEEFIKKIAGKKGISEDEIENITQVNFTDLPKEVNLENIDDTNLALYKITQKTNAPIFLIAFSGERIEGLDAKAEKEVYANSFLTFGKSERTKDSVFLETAAGTESGINKGYVMLREGSIMGISTNLEVLNGDGEVDVTIYKGEKPLGFSNSVDVTSAGIKIDYDVQSGDIVNFKPGDIISVYINNKDGVSIKDVTTLIEISSKI
jgi:hypothetical protein